MKNALRTALIAVALMTGIAPVVAQQFPSIQDHSVIGRIGIVGQPGPSQAIPLATLQNSFAKSGSSTTFATTNGALTPGDCVRIDANSNLVDSGSTSCGTNTNTPHTQDFLASTNFTAGTTTALTLSSAPTSTDLLIIAFDGVWQNANTWSLSGAIVTFNAAIPLNTQVVEAKWSTSSTLAGVGSIGVSGSPLTGPVTVSSPTGMITQAAQNIAFGLGNYTSPLTGGVARTVNSKLTDFISVKDFGAVCDGVTDDITAINAALAAVPTGGRLHLPTGFCASSTTIVRATPITIIGTGMYNSGFTLLPGASPTTDLFSLTPTINTLQRGFSFSNMGFFISNTGGRSAIILNTSAGTSTGLAEVVFDRVDVTSASANANNYAIWMLNGANPNGSPFNFTFSNGIINGGVHMDGAGDSLRFINNIITGPNAGIGGSQVVGGGNLVIENNNVSSVAGGVVLSCAFAPRIFHNEFEQQVTSFEPNNAIIDLIANVCTVQGTTITENQIQANAGIGNPLLVRISSNTSQTFLSGNFLATPVAYVPVSNASASFVCGNNVFVSGSPHVGGTAPSSTWGNGC